MQRFGIERAPQPVRLSRSRSEHGWPSGWNTQGGEKSQALCKAMMLQELTCILQELRAVSSSGSTDVDGANALQFEVSEESISEERNDAFCGAMTDTVMKVEHVASSSSSDTVVDAETEFEAKTMRDRLPKTKPVQNRSNGSADNAKINSDQAAESEWMLPASPSASCQARQFWRVLEKRCSPSGDELQDRRRQETVERHKNLLTPPSQGLAPPPPPDKDWRRVSDSSSQEWSDWLRSMSSLAVGSHQGGRGKTDHQAKVPTGKMKKLLAKYLRNGGGGGGGAKKDGGHCLCCPLHSQNAGNALFRDYLYLLRSYGFYVGLFDPPPTALTGNREGGEETAHARKKTRTKDEEEEGPLAWSTPAPPQTEIGGSAKLRPTPSNNSLRQSFNKFFQRNKKKRAGKASVGSAPRVQDSLTSVDSQGRALQPFGDTSSDSVLSPGGKYVSPEFKKAAEKFITCHQGKPLLKHPQVGKILSDEKKPHKSGSLISKLSGYFVKTKSSGSKKKSGLNNEPPFAGPDSTLKADATLEKEWSDLDFQAVMSFAPPPRNLDLEASFSDCTYSAEPHLRSFPGKTSGSEKRDGLNDRIRSLEAAAMKASALGTEHSDMDFQAAMSLAPPSRNGDLEANLDRWMLLTEPHLRSSAESEFGDRTYAKAQSMPSCSWLSVQPPQLVTSSVFSFSRKRSNLPVPCSHPPSWLPAHISQQSAQNPLNPREDSTRFVSKPEVGNQSAEFCQQSSLPFHNTCSGSLSSDQGTALRRQQHTPQPTSNGHLTHHLCAASPGFDHCGRKFSRPSSASQIQDYSMPPRARSPSPSRIPVRTRRQLPSPPCPVPRARPHSLSPQYGRNRSYSSPPMPRQQNMALENASVPVYRPRNSGLCSNLVVSGQASPSTFTKPDIPSSSFSRRGALPSERTGAFSNASPRGSLRAYHKTCKTLASQQRSKGKLAGASLNKCQSSSNSPSLLSQQSEGFQPDSGSSSSGEDKQRNPSAHRESKKKSAPKGKGFGVAVSKMGAAKPSKAKVRKERQSGEGSHSSETRHMWGSHHSRRRKSRSESRPWASDGPPSVSGTPLFPGLAIRYKAMIGSRLDYGYDIVGGYRLGYHPVASYLHYDNLLYDCFK